MRSLVFLPFALAALCASLLLLAGPGVRLGLWHFRTGFSMMEWAAYGGLAAAACGLLLASARREALSSLAAAALLGAATWAIPWSVRRAARQKPPIHDLTTDLTSPPEFRAVLPLRADAPNPAAYGGPEIARQQQAAYPDLAPAKLALPPAEAFSRALGAAKVMGWTIVAAEPAEGRLEATDTTFWFGFKDDIVVRVRPDGAGARVDVRSVSRVGKGDAGANARRIRRFVALLTSA